MAATTAGSNAPAIELTSLSNLSLTTLQTSITADTGRPLLGTRRDSTASAASASTATPSFVSSTQAAFAPTVELQLQTPGKPWLSFPSPLRPNPIPIFSVSPATGAADRLRFISYRYTRRSGNCFLVDADDDRPNPARLAETCYRFGPGKNPKLRIARDVGGVVTVDAQENGGRQVHADVPPPYSANAADAPSQSPTRASEDDDRDAADDEDGDDRLWEETEVKSVGTFTRAQRVTFPSLGGTFEWRYGNKHERSAYDANNLLILEWVGGAGPSSSSSGSGSKGRRVRVAQLVRNEAYRTPGTGASTAGNGGRVMVDLGFWSTGKEAEASGAADRALAMVAASALVMLKKEVDRRRMAQIAIMSGAASGGP